MIDNKLKTPLFLELKLLYKLWQILKIGIKSSLNFLFFAQVRFTLFTKPKIGSNFRRS